MTTKGIIFSAPMVRALLAGAKTQTRRLIQTTQKDPAPGHMLVCEGPRFGATGYWFIPPYDAGDRLYVREAWTVRGRYTDVVEVGYRAHERASHTEYVEQWPVDRAVPGKGKWPTWPKYGPSIHMPRWASRLWLEVAEVRVERLQGISETDAVAEGIEPEGDGWRSYETILTGPHKGKPHPHAIVPNRSPVTSYRELWDSLHTEPGQRWDDNPWVVAVSFRVHHGKVDQASQ